MSEALDQLYLDLGAIDRFLVVEAALGALAKSDPGDTLLPLKSGGLIDREFHDVVVHTHMTARAARAAMPVVTGTLLLYVAGRFESFVRETVAAAAREIGAKCGQFDRLPKAMKTSLTYWTAQVVQNPRKFGHAENGARSFLKRMAAGFVSITEEDPVNHECISVTESNMRHEVVKELCDRIGISDVWSQMSAQASLKKYFGTFDQQVVQRDAQTMLNKMMDERNALAHPAGATMFPTAQAIAQYVEFVKELATVFESIVDTYVQIVQPSPVVAPGTAATAVQ